MNPILKKVLITLGIILAVVGLSALVFKGLYKREKWYKHHDRHHESSCCKCCSGDDDDDEDDDDDDGKKPMHRMMNKEHGKDNDDMPMKKRDKKDKE